jgi:glutamate/tyrosine decarboxylase-like PLP-dependent enzyme
MDPTLAGDLADLPALLDQTRELAGRVLAGVDSRPVARQPDPAEVVPVPVAGIGLRRALEVFQERWEPALSGSAGPRFLGFVTGGATPASLAGDWLVSTFDQNVVINHDSAASDLERETVRWLAELFGLGGAHAGAFVTGATMSNFVGLATAREWIGEQLGVSVADKGIGAVGQIEVLAGTPHSTIHKALSMLGIGRDSVRLVPTLPDREAVDIKALEEALKRLDGRPSIVVAATGTVNSVDFDDLQAIAALAEHYPFWLHADGAFGAFAALSPEHAHLVAGLSGADSVCVDLHKWLNVPYDSGIAFTRHRDLQFRVFRNIGPYLGTPTMDNPELMHLTPESSRRLRALTAWFTLAAYGAEGHRDIVERNIACAQRLGALLADSGSARLLAPVRLNVVMFAPAGDPTPERVAEIARAIAAGGEAFMTLTVYKGQNGLRAAFSNWRTTDDDVDRVHAAIMKAMG